MTRHTGSTRTIDDRFSHDIVTLKSYNTCGFLEKFLYYFGYICLEPAREYRVTVSAVGEDGGHALIVVERRRLKGRSDPDIKVPWEEYPWPNITQARIEVLQKASTCWLYDHPTIDGVRVDYFAIPDLPDKELFEKPFKVTYRRGVCWRRRSAASPSASIAIAPHDIEWA